MNEIIVRPEEIKALAKEGGKLVFKKEAEESLIKLLELQSLINEQVELVKSAIIEAGTSIDASFLGVRGERVKASYRFFGPKYTYSLGDVSVASPFLEKVEFYKVIPEKVEAYLEEVGELPPGIKEKARTKSLVISTGGDD